MTALGNEDKVASVEGSMATAAHGKSISEVVGNEIARQILAVVIALHIVVKEPLLGAARADVDSV